MTDRDDAGGADDAGRGARLEAVFDTRGNRLHILPCPFARSPRFQNEVVGDGDPSDGYIRYDDLDQVPDHLLERLCHRCFHDAESLGIPPTDPGFRRALAERERTRDADPSDESSPGPAAGTT